MTVLEFLILILVVAWLSGMKYFPLGGFIHVLIVIAIVLLIVRLLTGRKVV